uniref:Late embryogenesis abundant protein LEA-2 subgroup domain-containing protein n=1 Tax=Fagus sylvatica TaxID=28930 RepID=A0A2N9H7H8_FAGSY
MCSKWGCYFCCCYLVILSFVLGSFIFWLIFLPKEIEFKVTEASLTQFDFNTNNNTLNYNLALNITLRNSNKRVGIYYRRVQAIAYYKNKWFATVNLTPFYQGHKNTTTLMPVFEGQQVLFIKPRDVTKFNAEKSDGVYIIDVRLSFKIKVRYGKIKTLRYKPPKIDCPLKVALSSNGNPASGFKPTWCDNVNFFSDPNADS